MTKTPIAVLGIDLGKNSCSLGRQLVGRSTNIQPTLTVRPGLPVRVIVTRDLVLGPYHD